MKLAASRSEATGRAFRVFSTRPWALVALAAALALPPAAQAKPPAGAEAITKSSVRAELRLKRAAELADDAGARAQARAGALLTRSRHALKAAMAGTKTLISSAESPEESDAATNVGVKLSSTLSRDAALQSEIAIEGRGRLERKAANALVSDLRMHRALMESMLELAVTKVDEEADDALASTKRTIDGLTAAIESAAAAAGSASAKVGKHAEASAELAVGIGAEGLATIAGVVPTVLAEGDESKAAAAELLAELMESATQVARTIESNRIEGEEVTLPDRGKVTLGTLAELGVAAATSAETSTSLSAEASASLTA